MATESALLQTVSLLSTHRRFPTITVPQDPLSIERVEIVRGPAALLYGGNAIGGVVNTIDNRIPREPIKGVTGTVDANASANDARAGAAQVEGEMVSSLFTSTPSTAKRASFVCPDSCAPTASARSTNLTLPSPSAAFPIATAAGTAAR